MKFSRVSSHAAAVRTFALSLLPAVGLAASAPTHRSAPNAPTALASEPPAMTVPTAQDRPIPSCGPGPERLSDMNITREGFLRPQSRAGARPHEFAFTRAIYSENGRSDFGLRDSYLGDRGPAWSTDYPNADRVMVTVITRLSSIDACSWEHPLSLADPNLRYFPFLYTLEWGNARLSEQEVTGLRDYLMAGGFLMVDDFWGTYEWENFEREMGRVLPGYPIVDIPRDHVLFRSYYTVPDELLQIPNVGNGRAVGMALPGARTWEDDGFIPHLRGIFDDHDRLMVAINWNTDLGDALEWAEDPSYPLEFSGFASRLFLNHIIYAMTH